MFPSSVLGESILQTDESLLSNLIKFPQEIQQIAGVQYAIVVNYFNAPPAGAYQALGAWSGSGGNNYQGGEYFHSLDGQSWFASGLEEYKLHFQTYVIPNSEPEILSQKAEKAKPVIIKGLKINPEF
jgi:hypothetical protein